MHREPLFIFSPLPPVRNGIADYCAELLPLHARDFDCTVVIDNAAPNPCVPEDVRVLRLAQYEAREQDFSAAAHLYHVGNNPDHVYLLPVLMRRPGVVVIHDVSMHHLIDCQTLRWDDVDGYCDALVREYGRPGQLLAEQFRSDRWREQIMFYELPMNRSVVARSRAVIVHSEFARVKVQAQDSSATVVHIPHHLSPSALDADFISRSEARERLGLDPDRLVFMSMGFVTRAKQVGSVLQAMSELRYELPPFQYLIAGEAQPDQYNVDADIARYDLDDLVTVTGYVPDELFFTYIAAADVIINLRYPTGGETSGTLMRALGSGACVMVVDHGPFAELPDAAAIKLPWGPDFEPRLLRSLQELAFDAGLRSRIGKAARTYVRSFHTIEGSAAAYRNIIANAQMKPQKPWAVTAPWEFATPAAHEAALATLTAPDVGPGSLWWRQAVLPMRSDDPVSVVVCSSRDDCTRYLNEVYGHAAPAVERLPATAWPDTLMARPERGCDLLLVALPIEQVGELWRGLVAANRILALGGIVVLDLWQGDGSDVSRDLTHPDYIDGLVLRAGFRLRRRWTGPDDVSFALDLAEPDAWQREPRAEVCWQAVKISEFIDPPEQRMPETAAPNATPEPAMGRTHSTVLVPVEA